ncbi:MAG: hypothetical protein JXN10_02155, partial [Clostridia bacterium]|nr:hypothetical protein [Clostridia bacterium]
MPSGGLASVVDQETNTAYIYGGMSPGMVHNKLYRFDLNSEEFSVIDTLPIPDRINHRLYHTLDNSLVIVSGALINNVPNPETVEVLLYDIDTGDISVFDTKIPFRGQFGSSFDKEH